MLSKHESLWRFESPAKFAGGDRAKCKRRLYDTLKRRKTKGAMGEQDERVIAGDEKRDCTLMGIVYVVALKYGAASRGWEKRSRRDGKEKLRKVLHVGEAEEEGEQAEKARLWRRGWKRKRK